MKLVSLLRIMLHGIPRVVNVIMSTVILASVGVFGTGSTSRHLEYESIITRNILPMKGPAWYT